MKFAFKTEPQPVCEVRTEHRLIKTEIPCPGTREVLEKLEKYESRSMQGQLPIVWDRAEDIYVYDMAGNKWIDFTCTIFVMNTGHSNRRVVGAVKDVLERPLMHTYAYANPCRADYLEALINFTGGAFEKAFLLSAGTEAVEAGIKLMKMRGQKVGKRRTGIISLEGNWHGRTLGAQMLSSNAGQKQWIGYEDENVHHLAFPYPRAMEGMTGQEFWQRSIEEMVEREGVDPGRDLCGVMLETFQGWGAWFYPVDYVQAAERFCRDNDLVLAFDEMQSGFGRTGTKFGYEHYGVRADMVCCGKGMGSGVPLSAVLSSAEIMDLPGVGSMSSTHSANPIVCAAGLATIRELTESGLIENARAKGEIFLARLEEIRNRYSDTIERINGRGLVAAIIFKNDGDKDGGLLASRICERCMQKGLLVVHTGRESIKLAPPLTIGEYALFEGLDVLEESVGEVAAQGVEVMSGA